MSQAAKPLAWSDTVRSSEAHRARFIESHLDLVRYLSLRIASRLPAGLDLDDLVHEGIVGLLDAVQRFDPGRGVRFRTYAESRVRGAILDSLRQKDWRPRSVRARQRALDETLNALASINGRPATEEETARAMGLDLGAYHSLLQSTRVGPLLALSELSPGKEPAVTAEDQLPYGPLERRELLQALANAIRELPERERRVLELYYHEGLNMKEVGALLGVTESRVCQLHAQAAGRLRGMLRERLHAAPQRRPRGKAAGGSRRG